MSGEEMNDELAREMEERALDMRVIAALERVPDGDELVPERFAERVAARVPARRPVAFVAPTHYGRTVMWCSLVVLVVLLMAASVRGAQSSVGTVVEWVLFAQFLGLAVWLGVRQWRTN